MLGTWLPGGRLRSPPESVAPLAADPGKRREAMALPTRAKDAVHCPVTNIMQQKSPHQRWGDKLFAWHPVTGPASGR